MRSMYYIGLDIRKRIISYCVKDGSGTIYVEGTIPSTRLDLDRWLKNAAAATPPTFAGFLPCCRVR